MDDFNELLNKGIKVSKLIEQLQACDPDATVLVASDYGDRNNTAILSSFNRVWYDNHRVSESAYGKSGWALRHFDQDRGDVHQFVIITI